MSNTSKNSSQAADQSTPKHYIIYGPQGSGKTKLAISKAEELGQYAHVNAEYVYISAYSLCPDLEEHLSEEKNVLIVDGFSNQFLITFFVETMNEKFPDLVIIIVTQNIDIFAKLKADLPSFSFINSTPKHYFIYGEPSSDKVGTAKHHAKTHGDFSTIKAEYIEDVDGDLEIIFQSIEPNVLVISGCKPDFDFLGFIATVEAKEEFDNPIILFILESEIHHYNQEIFPQFNKIRATPVKQPFDWQTFLDSHIDGDVLTSAELIQSLQLMHHRAVIQMNSDGCNFHDLDAVNSVARIFTAILLENQQQQA